MRLHRNSLAAVFLLVAALSLAACETLSTQKRDPDSGQIRGLPYYLPIGKLTMQGEFKAAGQGAGFDGTWDVTITPAIEADAEDGMYYVTPHANYLYDDDISISVNAKRLLSTGEVTSQDRTLDIVGEVASMVTGQVKALVLPTPSPTPASRMPFDLSFRPSNFREYQEVRRKLDLRGITMHVTPEPVAGATKASIASTGTGLSEANGLLFRPAIVYEVHLTFMSKAEDGKLTPTVDKREQFILPDPRRLYQMPYRRMAFVKRVKKIGFTDGLLTSYGDNTPSPILGFLGLPKAIIKAVVPLP